VPLCSSPPLTQAHARAAFGAAGAHIPHRHENWPYRRRHVYVRPHVEQRALPVWVGTWYDGRPFHPGDPPNTRVHRPSSRRVARRDTASTSPSGQLEAHTHRRRLLLPKGTGGGLVHGPPPRQRGEPGCVPRERPSPSRRHTPDASLVRRPARRRFQDWSRAPRRPQPRRAERPSAPSRPRPRYPSRIGHGTEFRLKQSTRLGLGLLVL